MPKKLPGWPEWTILILGIWSLTATLLALWVFSSYNPNESAMLYMTKGWGIIATIFVFAHVVALQTEKREEWELRQGKLEN